MASNMIHQLHLKPYPRQLSSSPRFSAPIAMNRPYNSCSTYTANLFCSFSNRSSFVVANTIASNEMVLVTEEQPFKGTSLNLSNMSNDQVMNHMNAGHHHVDHDADKNFDPNSVFVVVDNILMQATHTVDNAFLELSLSAQKINISLLLRKMQTVLCRRQIEEDVEAAYWEVEYPNALGRMIRLWGMINAFASTNPDKKAPTPANPRPVQKGLISVLGQGQRFDMISIILFNQKPKYTFFYGGQDKEWIKKFGQMVGHVAQDKLIIKLGISIVRYPVGNDNKIEAKKRLLKVTRGNSEKVNKLLDLFKTDKRGWVVLSDENAVRVSDHEGKMLAVLERFDEHWKAKVEEIGFGRSFEYSHNHFK